MARFNLSQSNWFILSAALLTGCGAADELSNAEHEGAVVGDTVQPIRDPFPVDPDAMLEMVQVATSRGTCSGVVIASDTVLTAAHCFCGEGTVGTPSCKYDATVTFRPDASGSVRIVKGVARVNPSYNPSWTEGQYEHDVATVTLNGVAPAHVTAARIGTGYLPTGTIIRIAGFGRTGSTCAGGSGTLNFDTTDIDGYEDGHDIMAFDQRVWCPGDSGGGVFDADGRLRGVISMETPWTQKAVTTGSEFGWITAGMCRSTAVNRCDGWGAPCKCTAQKDILWQNASGQLGLWSLDGANVTRSSDLGVVYSDWKVQGSGDFDGNGQADILWRHVTGQVAIWHMQDGVNAWQAYPGSEDRAYTWKIQATADFDADGRTDILWRHTSGQLAIWFEGNVQRIAYPGWNNQPAPVESWWTVKAAADFNGDRYADILWQDTQGKVSIWFMSGGTRIGENSPGVISTNTQLAAIGDFDGNLKADILWRSADGILWSWFSGVKGPDAIRYRNEFGPGNWDWAVQGAGDFDHDGRDDILWRHKDGHVAIWLVQGARFNGELYPPLRDKSWQIKTLLHASGL